MPELVDYKPALDTGHAGQQVEYKGLHSPKHITQTHMQWTVTVSKTLVFGNRPRFKPELCH